VRRREKAEDRSGKEKGRRKMDEECRGGKEENEMERQKTG